MTPAARRAEVGRDTRRRPDEKALAVPSERSSAGDAGLIAPLPRGETPARSRSREGLLPGRADAPKQGPDGDEQVELNETAAAKSLGCSAWPEGQIRFGSQVRG